MSSISPKAKRLKWGCNRDKLDHNSNVLSPTSPMIVWNFGCFFWFKIRPVALSSLKAAFEARVDDAWSALLLTKVWATCVGCKARKAERLQAMKYLGSLELPQACQDVFRADLPTSLLPILSDSMLAYDTPISCIFSRPWENPGLTSSVLDCKENTKHHC